jgi:hypothetical protein
MLGYRPRQLVRQHVACLLGISREESARIRPSRVNWTTNVFPLVDASMDRSDCEALLRRHAIPIPFRSACVFCPYHSDDYWRQLRKKFPQEWQRAVEFDRAIRDMSSTGVRSPAYLHRTCTPLELVDLGNDGGAKDVFGKDCEGLCGV